MVTRGSLVAASLLVAACGHSGATPVDGPKETFTLSFGTVSVAAGVERTQCVTKRLGNPAALHVGTLHNELGPASHHMIVYKVADTVEQLTPVDCKPFTNTLDPAKGAPLMITQKKDEVLALPAGVAYTFDPNQMLRIEVHYINATASDVMLTATAHFESIPDAQFKNEAGFLFLGDIDIRLAPMKQATVGPASLLLPTEFDGINFFAITGHTHQLGTNVKVSTSSASRDRVNTVYEVANWTWSESPTVFAPTPFQLPAGGGFTFSCDYNNTTANQVKFGESANAEMCFFWAYYYPNKGARVCAHTEQIPGGLDVCCPGSNLCSRFFP